MRRIFLGLVLMVPLIAGSTELDMLPLGDVELANELGSAGAGSIYESSTGATVELEKMAGRFAEADVVLLGEEHTAMDQKLLHAEILDAMAATTERSVVLAMEFFQRSDGAALERWARGEIDDRQLLEEAGWYDRGGYRWEYYRPVMEVARSHGMRIVGANVPREIPRAVNRGGLAGLSDEQSLEVGEVTTDGSPQHRYLISRYFGDTVSMLPPGWFEKMYAAQCLWDVVMARSILAEVETDTTVVLVVGSGHIAYDLGIPRRLDDEREAAGLPRLRIATFCPATAPAPDPDGEPSGHPMGGGQGDGESAASPAQFARSLADYVGVFADRGGIEAFPTVGLRLKSDDADQPVVSMVWPDTLAKEVGFESGDRILDINGIVPENLGEFRFLLAEIDWGQRLGIRVQRGEETVEVAALLYPTIDTSDVSAAPGYVLETMVPLNPASSLSAAEQVFPKGLPEWTLVTNASAPERAELRRDGVLDEVHELDQHGHANRSVYRFAHENGTVERRYLRDDSGTVTEIITLDRTGKVIE